MTHPLRFGIWAPVHGPRAAHQDPEEPYDASWERSRDLGGTAAGLVGGYDVVADRIVDFRAAGIELFMLQFQPSEMKRFAEEVIPRVRQRQAGVARERKAG